MFPEVYSLCTTREHTFVLTLQPKSSTETQFVRTLHEGRMLLDAIVELAMAVADVVVKVMVVALFA
jgi:hypothetical protein